MRNICVCATSSGLTTVGEIDRHLSATTDESVMSFWEGNSKNAEQFPRLYWVHEKHHCIPATSAAMGRVFSAAGYIVNARRSSLSDSLIEDMLLAKCNADLLP